MSTKILMVCLGNICRSPLAEGILKSKVPDLDVILDSAGTGAWHAGELPDKRSIEVAKKYNIDLAGQRARQITKDDLSSFDIIYVMDQSNYNNVISMCSSEDERQKIKLILNEISELNLEVPDPYYGGEDGFENVFKMLDLACDNIVLKLKK